MKRIISLTVVLFSITSNYAQPIHPTPFHKLSQNSKDHETARQKPVSDRSSIIPVWEEDFSNGIPGNWSLIDYSGICPWKYTFEGSHGWYSGNFPNAGVGINSTSSSNGFIISDVDSSNQYNYGQPAITKYHYLETYIKTNAIDLTGYPMVYLEFEQFFRFQNNVSLYVSVSNNGISWTDFDVSGNLGNNQYSQNPDTVRIDISAIAGNQPTVYIKWGWSSRLFFWMIDDVRIVPAPDNDLSMDKDYYNGISDPSGWRYYTKVPQRQARADSILYGGQFSNKGGVLQPNTRVEVTVTGADYWTGSSTPVDLDVLLQDSANLTTKFAPFNLGVNDVELAAVSDSIDETPDDNSLYSSFEVTDTVYARDFSNFGGQGWWYGAGIPYTCGLIYEINTVDTATSISIVFQGNTTSGSTVYLRIYDEYYNLVISSPLVTLNNSMTGGWHTWKIPATELSPGKYIIAFQAVSGSVLIGSDDNPPQTLPNLVYSDVYNNGFWTNIVDFTPLIRLNTKAGTCAGFYCDMLTTVAACGNNNGTAMVSAYGGSSPYSYQWDSNAGNATTDSIGALTPGNYIITITDSLGCTSIKTAVIVDALPPELSLSSNDVKCGADCDGSAWVEAVGYPPFSFNWSTSDTTDTIIGLCAGIYTVTVTDNNNCTSVDSLEVVGPDPISVSISTIEDSGNSDGSASVIPTGGVTPYTYLWDSTAGNQTTWTATGLAGGQNQGYYNVTITDGNGCDTVITVYVGAVGIIDSRISGDIRIVPNPTNGIFYIRLLQLGESTKEIQITDIAGKNIFIEKTIPASKRILSIDLSHLSKGIYLIHVRNNDKCFSRKLILF